MPTVKQAEQDLATARADEQKQKRDDATRELKRLTAEGAKLQTELQGLAAQINEAQHTRLRLHGLLVQARQQIEAYSEPLDPLTFPTDADEAYRIEQLGLWREKQRDLLSKHRAAVERESVRPYAISVKNRLERIQYEIVNLTTVARGGRPGDLVEKGINYVREDFIGNMQTTHL